MNHGLLMCLTSPMPMKTIPINGEPYLERYYMGSARDGTQYWLHRFLRNDSERHLHSHPWRADSYVLCGWYVEELEGGKTAEYHVGDVNSIVPEKLHRIRVVAPNTWTLMVVAPERLPTWYFIDDNGCREVRHASASSWHLAHGPRP